MCRLRRVQGDVLRLTHEVSISSHITEKDQNDRTMLSFQEVLRHSKTDWIRDGKIRWWEAWSQWLGGEIKLSWWILILKMWTRKENSGKINQKEREKTEGWECVNIWTRVLELAKTSTNSLLRGSSEGAGKLEGIFPRLRNKAKAATTESVYSVERAEVRVRLGLVLCLGQA